MTLQKIVISAELKEVLNEISDSLVAQLLLKEDHSIEDLADDFVNYISFSKKDRTKISYLPKERSEGLTEEECFMTSKRIMAKPGGFISKVFKNIPEKEVEKFSTLFRSEITKPRLNFKVVEGSEIKAYYLYSSYAERNGGSLHASCMKHNSCQSFLDIYSKNPDVCKMVLLFDSEEFAEGDYYDQNKIVGRALLWDISGHKLMDRIYTINDEKYQFYFKQWATKNGYLFKTQQNWFNTKYFEKLGSDKQKIELELDLKYKSFDYVPYMDTFKFMDYDGVLYNYQPEGKDFYTLTDTGGRKNGYDHLVNDFVDDVLRYRGEAIRLRYLGDNKWTHPNNCNYSEIMDLYILKDHSHKHEVLNDWIFNEEYSSNNDNDRINERVEWIKQREEERRLRAEQRKSRSSSYDDYLNTISGEGIRVRFEEMINRFYIDPETLTMIEQEAQEDLRVEETPQPVVERIEETPQPVRTDTMREEPTTATQGQGRVRRVYREERRPRLDELYMEVRRERYNNDYNYNYEDRNRSIMDTIEHVTEFINYEYREAIRSYEFPQDLIRYISERVVFSYFRGRVRFGDIVDMINTNLSDEAQRYLRTRERTNLPF